MFLHPGLVWKSSIVFICNLLNCGSTVVSLLRVRRVEIDVHRVTGSI